MLWDRARPYVDRVVKDISEHFRILDGIELLWTPALAARHYTRLYGQSLPSKSTKLRECGSGPPLLLVVADDTPCYAEREKWGRTSTVNATLFDAKQRYRQWVGAPSIHCTTHVGETDHDLFLLLGVRSDDYAGGRSDRWSGVFRPLRRDLTGSGSWPTRADLFTAIDLTLRYVSLQPVAGGPDIRLLVEGWWPHWGVEWLIAEPDQHPEATATRTYPVRVGGRELSVRLYHHGDGCHDARWQAEMLSRRVTAADGEHVLAPYDAYLELLHEYVRRGAPASADRSRLADLAAAAGCRAPNFSDAESATRELAVQLAGAGYEPAGPDATGPSQPPRAGRLAGLARRLTRRLLG